MNKRIWSICFALFTSTAVSSQILYLDHYNFADVNGKEHYVHGDSTISGNSIYPKIYSKHLRHHEGSWIKRKLMSESTVLIDNVNDFYLTIDPVFNFQLGRDLNEESGGINNLYTNTRGFSVAGNIADKVGFETSFYENQAEFPSYIDDYIRATGVVPGQGRVKPYKQGYDYSMANGYLYFKPSSNLNLMAGHGKHKIGEGYRSMILSTNSFNYPFFRTDLSLLKGQMNYTWMISSFQNLDRLPVSTDTEPLFIRKSGNFHYLTYNLISDRIRVGIIDATVFKTTNENGSRTFYLEQVNPLPLVNTLRLMNDTNHYTVSGFDLLYKVNKRLSLYSQFLTHFGDEKNSNALQFSLKYNRRNFLFLGEFNYAQDGFNGSKVRVATYDHYNQTLGHPVRNEFKEVVLLGKVNLTSRFFSIWKVNYIEREQSSNAIGALEGQSGVASTLYDADILMHDFSIGWIMNEANGMQFRGGLVYRKVLENNVLDTQWIYFAFRTYLPQSFYDF